MQPGLSALGEQVDDGYNDDDDNSGSSEGDDNGDDDDDNWMVTCRLVTYGDRFDPHSRRRRSWTKGNQNKKERSMMLLFIALAVTLMRIIHKLTISLRR